MVGLKQLVHGFLGGKGLGIQQGMSVCVALSKSPVDSIKIVDSTNLHGWNLHIDATMWIMAYLPMNLETLQCIRTQRFFVPPMNNLIRVW